MRRALLSLLVLSLAIPAAAQNKPAAEAAFKEARRLLKQGKVPEACRGFETSLALDPAPGTQLNLASCYARLGRTASAWAMFVEVADKDTKPIRIAEARRRAAELEPKLARLTVTVVADRALRVTRDGEDITRILGVASPVDPGAHRIVASWNGQEWTADVIVAAAKSAEVNVPRFWQERPAPVTAPAPAPAPAEARREPEAPPASPAPSRGKDRTWAWVTGGVGVAAIATGLVFGVIAKSRWDDSRDLGCHDDAQGQWVCPTQDGLDRAASAKTPSKLSTVFVVAGGVALVGAAVLWFTAPETSRPVEVAPAVAPGQLGLVVSGRF